MSKPGLFQSWRECAWKLSAMILFVVCVGSFLLWAFGVIGHTPKPWAMQF